MCEIGENAMQKKQFQQNMKDKVRVFEDGSIRLLKRGQKGVVHAIFSRFGLVLVLLLLQAFALFSLLQWFGGLLPHYFGGTLLVTAAMMVYLLNQDMDNSVRITWLVVTALMPLRVEKRAGMDYNRCKAACPGHSAGRACSCTS